MSRRLSVVTVALVATVVAVTFAQPNPYRKVENWFKVPADFKWGVVSGVYPDRDGGLWVAQRADPAVLKFNKSGELLKSFGNGIFHTTHGIFVDTDGHVWVPDAGPLNDRGRVEGKAFQVFKFDQDGKILMTMGKPNVSKAGPDTFIAPVAVVVNAKGEIFIADGHMPRGGQQDGDRIVKFAKDGTFIKQWGKKGSGPGELNGPHAMAIDSRGRLLVADRDNLRIQVFDQEGNYITHWMHYARPSGVWVDLRKDTMFVAHNADPGKVLPGWPLGIRIGSAKDGTLTGLINDMDSEVVGTDNFGNVYVWSQSRKALEKFVKN